MDDFDILEAVELIINRTQQATPGYSHAEIFEIIKRRFEELRYDLLAEEYKKRLAVKDEHKTTA